MKKVYLFVFSFLFYICSDAATVVVQVVSNQFNPSVVNVNVGDVVRFDFSAGGVHNATTNGVSNSRPAGAAAIFSGNPGATSGGTYDYTVTHAGTYKYICEAHADAGSFTGMVGQIIASGPMPALLKDFMISMSTEKTPYISWTTLNETNVQHFSIRRSVDGVNYKEVGKVAAAGNSTNEQRYTYTDNSITDQKYVYYHIAVVDRDGSEKLTAIKMFRNPALITKIVTQIGPNPISKPGQLMVYFNSEKNNFLNVKVFDMSGKLVLDTRMQAFPGINNGHIHVCDFESGTYTFSFTMDGVQETKRVVVQ